MRLHAIVVSLVFTSVSFSQTMGYSGGVTVRGEVKHDVATQVDSLIVEVVNRTGHLVVERATVMSDGSFELRAVPAGSYEIRLTNRGGYAVETQFVTVGNGTSQLEFRMPSNQPNAPGGSVSRSALEHAVNRKARKEFERADRFRAAGDVDGWVTHLEAAISADDRYPAAHHELGVALMRNGQPERAAAELRRCVTLDPGLAIGHANLAIALATLNRFAEAESEARRAAQLEPSLTKAEYVIGLCLLKQHKSRLEALAHLRRAYDAIPQAKALGAKLESSLIASPK